MYALSACASDSSIAVLRAFDGTPSRASSRATDCDVTAPEMATGLPLKSPLRRTSVPSVSNDSGTR